MSMYWRKHGEPEVLVYNDGRTKQAFKDETDINRLLARANREGAMSHLAKFEGQYGDFAEFDFLQAHLTIAKGGEIFDALPPELRREFGQSPADFFSFVNDPANKDRLKTIFPDLAKPGTFAPEITGRTPNATRDPDAPDPDTVVPPVAPDPVETP